MKNKIWKRFNFSKGCYEVWYKEEVLQSKLQKISLSCTLAPAIDSEELAKEILKIIEEN